MMTLIVVLLKQLKQLSYDNRHLAIAISNSCYPQPALEAQFARNAALYGKLKACAFACQALQAEYDNSLEPSLCLPSGERV